ncbi:MAG: hypothetical protein R2853_15810 [Thermomicrobiales bacterium]
MSGALARPEVGWPLAALLLAVVLWASSLPLIDVNRIGAYGLVPLFPAAFFASLALLIVSFAFMVNRDRSPAIILAAHVVALIVILHATPTILYGNLRYSWAWKHVGIVDYIQRHGSVDPGIGLLNAYHNWPGFFAFAALLTEAAGFESALGLAAWAPVAFNLLFVGAVFLVLQRFTSDGRLIWFGVWVFVLAAWVGQDYFAPQPTAYVLHLLILWICLMWLGHDPNQPPLFFWQWRPVRLVLSGLNRIAGPAQPADPAAREAPLWQQRALLAAGILFFATIAATHQLTPFLTILAVLALVVFDRCRARGLPILFMVLTVAWMITGALIFTQEHLLEEIATFGQTEGNVAGTLIDTSRADPSMRVIALAGRALTAGIGLLALLGILRRLRLRYQDLVPILLCGSSMLILAGSSYGGEVVFRVYLFSLPFLAFFAAACFYPMPAAGRSWWTALVSVALCGAMLAGFSLAYYGKEEMNHFTDGEVAATRYLYRVAPERSLIIEGTSTYPIRDQIYEKFAYSPIVISADDPRYSDCQYSVDELLSLLKHPVYPGTTEQAPASYLVVTRSQLASTRLLGACSIQTVVDKMARLPCVEPVFVDPDAVILTIRDDPAALARC